MSLLGLFRNKSEPVCQEHLQIALDGVYPGLSTFNMALNGFGCSVEIIVVPPEPELRPTFGGGYIAPPSPAKIIISIKYNGKWIRREYAITKYFYNVVVGAKHIINPIAFGFGNLKSKIVSMVANVKLNKVEPYTPEVDAKIKEVTFKVRRKK